MLNDKNSFVFLVIPANAGIQILYFGSPLSRGRRLDPRLHGDDKKETDVFLECISLLMRHTFFHGVQKLVYPDNGGTSATHRQADAVHIKSKLNN
jgi:hypothetical protein